MPIGSSTRSVTKSLCQPSAPNTVCKLSAKKLKYLKKPSSVRLNARLRNSSARRRAGSVARSIASAHV
jgi:hypothetical protein